MAAKSLVAVWRDAVRDSDLNATAKLVAHTVSTYMDGDGCAAKPGRPSPSRATIAAGCSLSDRAVDRALEQLEDTGWLEVQPKRQPIKGGKMRRPGGKQATNRYQATLAETANELRSSEWQRAKLVQLKSEPQALKSERGSHESAESAESGALSRGGRLDGAAASALCAECGTGGGRHLDDCSQALRVAVA